MASAVGGGIDGAAAGTTKKKKRISDCLVDSDGGDEVAGEDAMPPSPPSPGTPRLRIPMFTCARLRFVRLGRKGGGGRKDQVAAEKSEAASTDSSAGWKAPSSGASPTETAGMGLSLLFLLAKTCVELNKMAEVRAEMEALLREMRDQLVVRTTKVGTTTASPCQCHASSRTRTDGQDAGATSSSSPEPARPRHFRRDKRAGRKRRDGPFYALTGNPLFDLEREPCGRAAASSSAMETASETSSEVEDPSGFMAGEQFQLNCRTEQGTPESSSDGQSFIELEGGFGAGAGRGGYSARRWRDSEDGQGEEEEEEEGRGDEGVSAVELERRLQELLHRRSRERIEELEASLRRAERKVMEKEMEARLWKDTAKLALQPGTRGGTGQ
ncbi:uncharacterized protein LOC125514439 isoform X2 [Triticum urartu]|uniref:uncharacterized protein LOC125514439 isoform X2 n=1 Tax=Triticum urartu TaxID=4572 RepID=UPI002043C2AE|nr:uncharacterized protein LOC125514439 isoform X2 [Triticum urartu]